jgi:hypothetical protein
MNAAWECQRIAFVLHGTNAIGMQVRLQVTLSPILLVGHSHQEIEGCKESKRIEKEQEKARKKAEKEAEEKKKAGKHLPR